MRLYGQIQKVEPLDDGTVRVHGIASSEVVDDQGEVVRATAMRAAIPEYMQFPALREMHQLSAAGTTLEAVCDDDGCTRIVAHVVDPVAVKKVKNRVYRGFSIGGRVMEREAGNSQVITRLALNEISLVDRPANPEAVFDVWKAASGDQTMDGGLGTLGDLLAAQIAAQNPVQMWSCGVPGHQHTKKSDAAKCMAVSKATDTVQSVIAAAAGAIAKGDAAMGEEEARKADDGEDKKPYGDVPYADPGYQDDKKKRYPLDTAAHVRAAWSYVNMPKNADKYSSEQVSSIKAKIQAAGKKMGIEFGEKTTKALWDIGRVAESIMCLEHLKESLALERAMEGDDSSAPDEVGEIIARLCDFMRNLVDEETREIVEGTEVDPNAMSMPSMMALAAINPREHLLSKRMSEAFVKATRSARDQSMLNLAYLAVKAGSEVRGLAKGMKDHFDAAASSLEKAGAMPLPADYDRANPDDSDEASSASGGDTGSTTDTGDNPEHPAPNLTPPAQEYVLGHNSTVDTSKTERWVMSLIETALGKAGGHQHFADVAHDCVGKLTDGVACEVGKAGARFSAETMGHLRDAHEHLVKAGAMCKANMMDEPTTPTEDEHQGTHNEAGGEGTDLGQAGKTVDVVWGANRQPNTSYHDDELKKMRDQRDQLMAVVGPLTATVEKLAARVEQIASQPMPALTAGRGATHLPDNVISVGKTDDGRLANHDQQLTKEGAITPQMVEEFIKNMTGEQRVIFEIQKTMRRPFIQP
jgi:hypothetical protein